MAWELLRFLGACEGRDKVGTSDCLWNVPVLLFIERSRGARSKKKEIIASCYFRQEKGNLGSRYTFMALTSGLNRKKRGRLRRL